LPIGVCGVEDAFKVGRDCEAKTHITIDSA
jgi:hypothetical protein